MIRKLSLTTQAILLATLVSTLFGNYGFAARMGTPIKIADSSSGGYGYGYAPSMIYENGTYHCWYGSSGTSQWDWDHIRYVTSTDGVNWTAPLDVIQTSNATGERCACDPSVVYFGGYWYLYYSGNPVNVNTAHFVARATSPAGPWYKYTQRGTWEYNAPDPQVIIYPATFTNYPDPNGFYGAGQATVVNVNNRLHMWYADDTTYHPQHLGALMYTWSVDAVTWQPAVRTNLYMGTVDVKYDEAAQQFILYSTEGNHAQTSAMGRYFSKDGLNWTGFYNHTDLPDWSHNPGVLGDKYGRTIFNGKTIYGYGAPYDLSPVDTWAAWDLYGNTWYDPVHVKGDFDGDGKLDACMVDPANGKWYIRGSLTPTQLGTAAIPWGWQWVGMGAHHDIVSGDFDGDGKTDRAIVDRYASGGHRWYIISSATGGGGTALVPWGALWGGIGVDTEFVCADYDGDGQTDRAVIDRATSPGNTYWYIISSATGGGAGLSYMPWGHMWGGMSRSQKVVVGDYDGDGKADPAIVDPYGSGGNTWYVISSASNGGAGTALIPWGWAWAGTGWNWQPIVEDFDGDGKVDLALVSPPAGASGSKWHIISSATGGAGVPHIPWAQLWGGMLDHHMVICGDYDGDGKADLAMCDKDLDNTGAKWYVLGSSSATAPAHIPWAWALTMPYN